MEGGHLFLHLRKLSPSLSEETLGRALETLWSTRRTGLASHQKPYVQSLLALPSIQDLDLVLACLRLLIRKSVHEKLAGDDVQKLLPVDLSVEIRSLLALLIEKYRDQWTEEASSDQAPLQRPRVSYEVRVNAPLAITSSGASEFSSSLCPLQDDSNVYPNSGSLVGSVPNYYGLNLPHMTPVARNGDSSSLDSMAILPHLKSMTWTMENRISTSANRVAIITLKLQDYTKSPSGEIEVKFQLSKDTLEAMLRSMTYISEQLASPVTNSVEQASEPSSKKQKQ